MRTGVTIELEESTLRRIEALATNRGITVDELAAATIAALIDHDERYDAARKVSIELMEAATALGPQTWARDDLHER